MSELGMLEDASDDHSPARRAGRRANDLTGSEWTKYSISVWNDIRKDSGELQLKHPAMFPAALAGRLLECFTTSDEKIVLDPFLGSGSTLVAAQRMGKEGIGFEISPEFAALAESRLAQQSLFGTASEARIIVDDARNIPAHLPPESVDIAITSPPYWDILLQKRTADYKEIRHYGDASSDLGKIGDYEMFIAQLTDVVDTVANVLKPGKYFIINVMDIRKKSQFYPFHSDLAAEVVRRGNLVLDDIIIWDRRLDYNNLRSLGYPSVFRLNKVHEYLMVFAKPGRNKT